MGSSESRFTTIKNGFAEVASKIKWKKGLVVDVHNQGQFLVVGIYPFHSNPPVITLRTEERAEGTVYYYLYTGTQIITDTDNKNTVFEIELKPIANAKIGGSSRSILSDNADKNPGEPSQPENEHSENDELSEDKPSENDELSEDETEDIIIDEEQPNFTQSANKKLTVKCRPCSLGITGSCESCGKKNKSHANGRAPTSILDDTDDYFPDDNIADDD